MRGYPGRSNTLDEDFRADMDNAVSIERRLAAMKAFHDAGVRTTCFISPIFPGLTDLPSIIHRAKNQCNLVWLENLNLRGGYKKTIFDYITEKHPDLPIHRNRTGFSPSLLYSRYACPSILKSDDSFPHG